MLRYYVFERVTDLLWAERTDNPEKLEFSLDGFLSKSNGMESYWANSHRVKGTRLFYATRQKHLVDSFMAKMNVRDGEEPSETLRVWETSAFFGFQAATNAFRKHARLLQEIKGVATRTENDEREGELLVQSLEAGLDVETAKLVAKTLKDRV